MLAKKGSLYGLKPYNFITCDGEMVDFQKFLNDANNKLAKLSDNTLYYFQNCSQNELLAWGGNSLGLILIILGIIFL